MKTKAKHSFFRRAAIALLTMVLTATTAGARDPVVTFDPALQSSYTFTGWQIKPNIRSVNIDGVDYTLWENEDNTEGTEPTEGTEHIVNPVFRGVTLDATDRSVSFDLDDTEGQEKGITFCGTYDAMAFDAAEPSILFLGDANTLYYPESGAKIGAQRTYFQLDGLTAGESTSQVRAFNLRFVEDPLTEGSNFGSEDTSIVSLSKESGNKGNNPEFLNSLDYYTLDGVKLDGQPTTKGLYIHGGRKVVVK